MQPRSAAPASPYPGKRSNSGGYTASQSINTGYVDATRTQQTQWRPVRRMRRMNQQSTKKGNSKMNKTNITEFLAAARQHLFGLNASQPAFAAIPAQVCQVR